jgi:hypothetical protein
MHQLRTKYENKIYVKIRDVPKYRYRWVSAIFGGIGIGEKWPIPADTLKYIIFG